MSLELMQNPKQASLLDVSRTLSAAEIQTSDQLRRLGAMAGDKVDGNNQLVREVSTQPQGRVLLESDIEASENLRNIGAEAGDMVDSENRLIRSGSNDFVRNFMYNFDSATTVLGDTMRYLASEAPELGSLFFNVPEDSFPQMTPQERRDYFMQQKLEKLQEEYKFFAPDESNVSGFAGSIAGTLADPTSLLPLGGGLKAATAIGAGVGFSAGASKGLATEGEIDAKDTLVSTALGGVSGFALRGAANLVQQQNRAKMSAGVKKVTDTISTKLQAGTPLGDTIKEVSDNFGIPKEKVQQLMSKFPYAIKGRKSPEKAAEADLQATLVNDPAGSRANINGAAAWFDSFVDLANKISPKFGAKFMEYELNNAKVIGDRLKRVQNFNTSFKSMPTATMNSINRKLGNGLIQDAIEEGEQLVPNFGDSVREVQRVLREVADEYEIDFDDNYFPRFVKDYEGLKNKMGVYREGFDLFLEQEAKFRKKDISDLDGDEIGALANKFLASNAARAKVGTASPAKMKARTVEQVTEEIQEFYANPVEALDSYLRQTTARAQRNRIFGIKPNGETADDISDSFGEAIRRDGVSGEDVDKLKELAITRFTTGEKNLAGGLGLLRDVGYATTIANPISALTNLQDLASTMAMYGFKNTIKSMFGEKNVKLVDFAMDDALATDFVDVSKSSKRLSTLFKLSGFRAVDNLAKETTMNAAMRKFQGMSKSAKGRAKIAELYGDWFGNDYNLMMNQLQNGQVTGLTKMLTLAALSKQQPIFRSSNSKVWLESPKARMLYMLKNFMLRQLQLARDLTIKEYKAGNKTRAVKNATLLAGYLTTLGVGVQTTKDLFLMKGLPEPEELSDTAMWSLLGTYGLNEYVSTRYFAQGDISGGVASMVTPAMPLIDAIGKATKEAIDPEDEVQVDKLIRPLPVIGPIFYHYFGGGAEKDS